MLISLSVIFSLQIFLIWNKLSTMIPTKTSIFFTYKSGCNLLKICLIDKLSSDYFCMHLLFKVNLFCIYIYILRSRVREL